ncbi:hypothetical protein [Actinospica robiniae]
MGAELPPLVAVLDAARGRISRGR